MKRLFFVASAVLLVVQGCQKSNFNQSDKTDAAEGRMSVVLKYDSPVNKSLGDYDFVLSEEVVVNDVQVLVFDGVTGALQRSAEMASLEEECVFQIPVGSKIIYALINGPDVSRVKTLDAFLALADDLSDRDYRQDGFVMIGSVTCDVWGGLVARPVIKVGRMVSRVVLRSVLCNLARQYEDMTVDCVFLGNAAVEYSLAGDALTWANEDGYADLQKKQPVGIGVEGACQDYLYRYMGCNLKVGQQYNQPVCLYCYPNDTSDYTCLYILASIGGQKYYYRITLDKGLAPNVSCAVDVAITNLGAALPPDGDLQKGEIIATVSVEGWSMGYLYNAEF